MSTCYGTNEIQRIVKSHAKQIETQFKDLNLNRDNNCSIQVSKQKGLKIFNESCFDKTRSNEYEFHQKLEKYSSNCYQQIIAINNGDLDEKKKVRWEKDDKSSYSSLSLHIAAYEAFTEAGNPEYCGG